MIVIYNAPCYIEKDVIDMSNLNHVFLNIRISWDKELTKQELWEHIEFAKRQLDILLNE